MTADLEKLIQEIGLVPLVTFGAILFYFILVPFGTSIMTFLRRIFLFVFVLGTIVLLPGVVRRLIQGCDEINLDLVFRTYLVPYKGTDWFDGFLWGIAISLYVLFISHIWGKEKKVGKKTDKPLKVEVGNVS